MREKGIGGVGREREREKRERRREHGIKKMKGLIKIEKFRDSRSGNF